MNANGKHRVTAAGLLIALGVIYGDIGTSPLYVLSAIIKGKTITQELVLGSLSLVIWTLTLQTTVKYVLMILRADNHGEGGIFALYALIRRRRKWLVIPAMIGGASLLADGMITPPMSVTSAIEGLRNIPALHAITDSAIVGIVLAIIVVLFFVQQFGSGSIGKLFGPVMFVWFSMLAVLGVNHLADYLGVFKAFNPWYGLQLLVYYPQGFWIMGGVFLCTTGAEALYSDLGHCGLANIRMSWIFVKTCLILNYLGQGAWLLSHMQGTFITETIIESGFNPFYSVMPHWFLMAGIVIAATAAIIASQALISGSFTLISEAMRLNLWPKMTIKYPSEVRGQLYLPGINWLLLVGCCGVVLHFRKSSNMDAAYGLAITLCMLATTILFANFLVIRRIKASIIYVFLAVYLTIDITFLVANLAKFKEGGYIALLVAGVLYIVMYVWFRARKIKNRYLEFEKLEPHVPLLGELSSDNSVAKYATHLVYLTSADNPREIERKIVFSIFRRQPKRADIYWFVHVDTLDEPYTVEYQVKHILVNDVIRIDFRLGFRIQPRLDLMFRKVVKELVANHEVNVKSRYESLEKKHVTGDFTFIVTEKYLSSDRGLSYIERVVMKLYFWLKDMSVSEERAFGLEASNVLVERTPLDANINMVRQIGIKRVYPDVEEE
ncbi:KUP system potassium uptake protein [Filimonas lacunae]|uniref:Probable potassium transport system protein Kup n=1 Tax=Filimonas lacunae TaxID=477680 RepID=A0A173MHZ5_9BACT|nr:KUP/HAK/KT family potassium transporter [Filimonas lacunae]BAV07243.1 Kup system potassium uptake protein [Filimonas lacunae]SIS92660.1 KUP system potassium uptake protein [Filimonas lacunae]